MARGIGLLASPFISFYINQADHAQSVCLLLSHLRGVHTAVLKDPEKAEGGLNNLPSALCDSKFAAKDIRCVIVGAVCNRTYVQTSRTIAKNLGRTCQLCLCAAQTFHNEQLTRRQSILNLSTISLYDD